MPKLAMRRDYMQRWAQVAKMRIHEKPWRLFLIALFCFSFLAASCVLIAGKGSYTVTVTAWDRVVRLDTSARTVGDALEEANVVLGPNDYCSPGPEAPLTQGLDIKVIRASLAFVSDGGKVSAIETAKNTVGDLLSQAGISLGADDAVIPSREQPVPDDGRVRVVRVTYADIVEEEEIPYTIERRNDSSLEAGLVRVLRNGTEGLAKVTFNVRYEDGVEVSRQQVSRDLVKDPSPQVLLVGTLQEVTRGSDNIRFERAIEAVATAYCPCTKCCGPYANGYTHTGILAERGVIAVDPRVIPLGSRVYVDGYGFAVAADTGSAIKGNRVDVCFSTHEEALRWGRKQVKVYVIE
ncbi:MAG: DUF348 domain-containing protein [Firmicutes bacterium]|nr:DUF348 domain-containing protein [Candidatus Fermentithermobacillaceae bacterium]